MKVSAVLTTRLKRIERADELLSSLALVLMALIPALEILLRPLMGRAGDDPVFQQQFARANELAGDVARAGEAYAEAAYLNGRPEQALIQLQNLKKRDDLDFYARARIDARIAAITPEVLELRRQGIRDPDVERR